MDFVRRGIGVLMAMLLLCLSISGFAANEEISAAFEAAALALQSPAEAAMESRAYAMHIGEIAYVPSVAPAITPFDEAEATVYPEVEGTFESSDESIVSVDEKGRMTAVSEGTAKVVYHTAGGDITFTVSVSEENPSEIAKNMAYIARREFLLTKRARLPKYNKYAKWYYKRKNEVGWCSVFTIWCANAAGINPIKKSEAKEVGDHETLYLREGQVGNQFDGFAALNRFGHIPREGYLVIYADMSNAYRTTHVGIVVSAVDMGEGIFQVTTVEGNMSNSVKAYCYLYDSNLANHLVGREKGLKLQWNMSMVEKDAQTDPLVQYELHTDHWAVFGFCETWK